jgi:hypothetical protein
MLFVLCRPNSKQFKFDLGVSAIKPIDLLQREKESGLSARMEFVGSDRRWRQTAMKRIVC